MTIGSEEGEQGYHEIFEEKSGKILLAGLAFSMAACGVTDNKEKQMLNLVNNKTIIMIQAIIITAM